MNKDIINMIEDIESEVRYTASYIGKSKLDKRVMQAMAEVPREKFVPKHLRSSAYDNSPLPIGYGQTISQPYIVALMSDLLALKPEYRVLEIGTGSGYQTTVLSKLVGTVYSVERIEPLLKQAKRLHYKLRLRNIFHKLAKGKTFGWPDAGPLAGTLVTAAPQVTPEELSAQLAPGGLTVIPGGKVNAQALHLIERTSTGFTQTRIDAVRFVPLIGNN